MLSGRFRGGSELEGPGESLLVIRGGTGVAVVFEAGVVYLCTINTFYFNFIPLIASVSLLFSRRGGRVFACSWWW